MDTIRSFFPKTSVMTSTGRIAEPSAFFSIAYNAWHRGSFSELICGAIASFINSMFLFGATWMMIFHIDWDAVASCQLNSGCTNSEFVTSGVSLRSFSIFGAILAISFVAGCLINLLFALKHLIETYTQCQEVKDVVKDVVLIEEYSTPLHEFWAQLSGRAQSVASVIKNVRNPAATAGDQQQQSAADAPQGVALNLDDNNRTQDEEDNTAEDENARLTGSPREQQNQQQQSAPTPQQSASAESSKQHHQKQALEDISWSEFSHLLVKRCKKNIVHGDSFDELRLVQTIMLHDNYIIALHACNLLNGRSLRWVDEQLIREIIKLHFVDRRVINSGQAFEKVVEKITRWMWISIIFYPIVVSFFVIKALVRHAAEVRSQSARLATDTFTPEARWRTRLFNELPFLYENRLSSARKHLENVTSSSHAASSQLLRIPHRIAGIVITAILIVSLFSAEAAALGKFWGLSGAFWFSIALMVYQWTEGRASQAGSDDTTAGMGDQAAETGTASTATRSKSILQLMRPVSDFLLYEDVDWNIDKSTPRRCLDSLKSFYVVSRAMNAINRIFFVIGAPFFLYRLSSAKTDELWPISKFIEEHSAFVNGIGSACTFSIVPSIDEEGNQQSFASLNGKTNMPVQRDPLSSYFGVGNTSTGGTTASVGGSSASLNSLAPFSSNIGKNNSSNEQQQEMQERQPSSSESNNNKPAAASLPQQQVEFSTEDFRKCRIINSSAQDPYIQDSIVIHKRDISLICFGASHRHWTDSMKKYASDPARISLVSEQLQIQSRFMLALLPPLPPLWEHFKTHHNISMLLTSKKNQQNNANGDNLDVDIASSLSDAQFISTIKTTAQPENYVQLFLRLREYSEFDFLRLILDTRSESVLKEAIQVASS